MSNSGVRYSPKLIKKVIELREDTELTAGEIADRINGMKTFEEEPELNDTSVYGIVSRYGNGNGNSNGTKAKKAKAKKVPRHVTEYMTSFDGGMVTFTFSVPESKHLLVLKQLGIKE